MMGGVGDGIKWSSIFIKRGSGWGGFGDKGEGVGTCTPAIAAGSPGPGSPGPGEPAAVAGAGLGLPSSCDVTATRKMAAAIPGALRGTVKVEELPLSRQQLPQALQQRKGGKKNLKKYPVSLKFKSKLIFF